MNPTTRPQAPAPTPADDQPVTDAARRIGPPVAVGALVATAAFLAWLAIAPTAIAGPISEAPFTVPATLVVPPDDDGCLRVVEGDGTEREHCLDQLAADERDHRNVEAYFDDDGRLLAGEPPQLLHVDPVTGEVLDTADVSGDDPHPDEPPPAAPEDEPIEPIEAPEEPDARRFEVYARGDQVVRYAPSSDEPAEEDEGEVVLDLQAPPGYQLHDAVLSPDEQWIVALTGRDEVIVARVDGSAAPYVWTELTDDRWVDLWRGIRWDS